MPGHHLRAPAQTLHLFYALCHRMNFAAAELPAKTVVMSCRCGRLHGSFRVLMETKLGRGKPQQGALSFLYGILRLHFAKGCTEVTSKCTEVTYGNGLISDFRR